jgi:CRP/FNR family transcriptional regulator, cyclic AMP receptor protein
MLSNFDRLLLVRGVSIFRELRDDFLVRLSSVMEEKSFDPKQPIITQGEEGRSLYIVAAGQVRVHIARQELAQLSRGDFFGEMSLFDTEPRSASVTALDRCDCLELTQLQLYEAINETPGIALNLIGILSGRIRDLNSDVNALRAQLSNAPTLSPTSPPVKSSPPSQSERRK